jgi:hypothetical protein
MLLQCGIGDNEHCNSNYSNSGETIKSIFLSFIITRTRIYAEREIYEIFKLYCFHYSTNSKLCYEVF